MINPYSAIITHENDDWEDFFERICLIDIFKDLILRHGTNRQLLKSFIKYIVWAYSKDSDMITIGTDWGKTKRRIFDAAGFKPEEILVKATVQLQDDVVLSTIQRWLSFQDDAIFMQLQVLKDLQYEMQLSANSPIRKSSGEVDFDQKFKNACYVKDLRGMIKDLELELIQNSPVLKEAYKEVKSVARKNLSGVEAYV